MSNPILVNTRRGAVVENRHRGSLVVCDPRGRLIMSLGDSQALVFPRSSIKSLQAIPLVESGAAEHFDVSDIELALACSSHNAEPLHTQTVVDWLARIDLDVNSLECGAHAPLHAETTKTLIANGVTFDRTHNNCSGKHTGMLTSARFFDEQTQGYIDRDHPAQQRWINVVGEMADVDMRRLPWSYDGCGVPVIAMPLASIACAFARFAVPDDLPQNRADSIDRIAHSIVAHPFMVAGTDRLCTRLMEVSDGRVMVKGGADGVYTAALPERGLGIAIKIDDGLREAAEVALMAALQHLDALHADELDTLAERRCMPIVNTRGLVTGYREPAAVWHMHA